ncbi:AAA family ATPase [Dokdonia sp. Asnod3-C12]|uniref:AAA family ATPase n=1 Tax=Dokdonia sp. Asnod3-C12 TaxID=3160575 RepID=UPI003867B0B7
MIGFKLLAIRPLIDCDTRFSKNLNRGQIFKFYQEYQFLDTAGNEIQFNSLNKNNDVAEIKTPEDQLDLYSPINSDLEINISAIVGKNGSGKSTLIELLFVSAYLLALDREILENSIHEDEWTINKTDRKKGIYKSQSRTKERITILNEKILNVSKKGKHNENLSKLKKMISNLNWNENHLRYLSDLEQEIPEIRKKLKVELYYQVGCDIIQVSFNKNGNSQFKIVNDSSETNINVLEDKLTDYFFYSLVLNYSQYALNSEETGVWIQELFHKNDAYQTPIVINPMRTGGNYDINTENNLARQRLLANILEPINRESPENSMRQLASGHLATRLKLEINTKKFENDFGKVELLENTSHQKEWKLIKDFFSLESSTRTKTDYDKYARQYIINKLISMSDKYSQYDEFCDGNEILNIEDYLDALNNDCSHITYKFFQAINFLKYNYAKDLVVNNEINDRYNNVINLSKFIKDHSNGEELIHCIPPPIFKTEIYFDDYDEHNSLKRLSSGEKQYIYSISSIMYHLRYLNSVDNGKVSYKYQYINLIFDEIELYYHPELQRSFINDLLEAIKRCNLNDIKSINCIFVTHSPFILSDIPVTNVLKLEDGSVNNTLGETFAANIHDLLASNFFLENGSMGIFAKKKIERVIDWINLNKKNIEEGKDYDREGAVRVKKIIKLVEEPVLRNKLTEMISEIEVDESFINDMINKQTKYLRDILNRHK